MQKVPRRKRETRESNEREMGYGTGLGGGGDDRKKERREGTTGFDKSVGNNTRHPVQKRGREVMWRRAM